MEIQQTPEKHPVLGGKAYVYKRGRSSYWQAAAYLRGYNYRTSTKETYLHEAIHYAEEWYFNLRGQASIGVLETPAEKQEKEKVLTFRDVADKFIQEYSVITEGQRSPAWIRGHSDRLRVHILPFLGDQLWLRRGKMSVVPTAPMIAGKAPKNLKSCKRLVSHFFLRMAPV